MINYFVVMDFGVWSLGLVQRWGILNDILGDLLQRVYMWMMPYGAETRKGTLLFTNQEGGENLKLDLDSTQRATIQTCNTIVENGVAKVSGTKDLKGTQSYPRGFGQAVAAKHLGATLSMGPGLPLEVLKSEHLASFLSDDPWDDADLEQILVDLKG